MYQTQFQVTLINVLLLSFIKWDSNAERKSF